MRGRAVWLDLSGGTMQKDGVAAVCTAGDTVDTFGLAICGFNMANSGTGRVCVGECVATVSGRGRCV